MAITETIGAGAKVINLSAALINQSSGGKRQLDELRPWRRAHQPVAFARRIRAAKWHGEPAENKEDTYENIQGTTNEGAVYIVETLRHINRPSAGPAGAVLPITVC